MAALGRLPVGRQMCLELALGQLSMVLNDIPTPGVLPHPPDAEIDAAREAASLLRVVCGHRAGSPGSHRAAREVLSSLTSQIDPDLLSLAEALHSTGSAVSLARWWW